MKYYIKEIFPTIQGEGTLSGVPSVFVRFSGCNLWSGREESRDRGKGECSNWCDTSFADGDLITLEEIMERVQSYTKYWKTDRPLIVVTGGEPFIHLTDRKCDFLYNLFPQYAISVETNGTVKNKATSLFESFGHTTISPKALKKDLKSIEHIKLRKCNDLKIVVPTPMNISDLIENIEYDTLYFQPMDIGDNGFKNAKLALELALKYDGKVSIQSHKVAGFR